MVNSQKTKVGILALQGDVIEHKRSLESASKKINIPIDIIEVRTPSDLTDLKGLILPGGESTTIGKLLKLTNLDQSIKTAVTQNSLALYGTCAGAILLSKNIIGKHQAQNLQLINIDIERNAFGRQLDSFQTSLSTDPTVSQKPVEAFFIRAPRIKQVHPPAKILASYQDEPVLVQQEKILVSTFHPELTTDTTIHEYFLKIVTSQNQPA